MILKIIVHYSSKLKGFVRLTIIKGWNANLKQQGFFFKILGVLGFELIINCKSAIPVGNVAPHSTDF